jgi:hypothetical protein
MQDSVKEWAESVFCFADPVRKQLILQIIFYNLPRLSFIFSAFQK